MPKWSDFSSEYGFESGTKVTAFDLKARAVLIEEINKKPEIVRNNLKAIAYDCTPYNSCMILVVTQELVDSVKDEDLVAQFRAGRIFSKNKQIDGFVDGRPAFEFFDLDEDGYVSWFGDNLVNEVYEKLTKEGWLGI